MQGARWIRLWVVVLAVALAALALPAMALAAAPPAGAAPDQASELLPGALIPNSQEGGGTGGIKFAVPGLLEARIGDGMDATLTVPTGAQNLDVNVATKDWSSYSVLAKLGDGQFEAKSVGLKGNDVASESASLNLPTLGANVTVDGFKVTPRGVDWNNIAVSSNKAVNFGNALKISDLKATLNGPSAGLNDTVSARVDLAAGPVQGGANLSYAWDAVKATGTMGVSDVTFGVNSPALGVDVSGVNYDPAKGFSLGNLAVNLPNASVDVSGFNYSPVGADWDTINIATPNSKLTITGPSKGLEVSGQQQVDVALGPVKAGGLLSYSASPATGQSSQSLSNGNLSVTTPFVNVALSGITSTAGSTTVASTLVTVPALGMAAGVSNLAVLPAGLMFDQAQAGFGQPDASGKIVPQFVVDLTRTATGYTLTTQTNIAAK